jgi:hypothetical protein
MRAGTSSAGTFVAQVTERIMAVMAILPVNLDALGFRNRYVFRFGVGVSHAVTLLRAFNIANSGDAPDGADHSLELLLVADLHGHVDHRAIDAALGV